MPNSPHDPERQSQNDPRPRGRPRQPDALTQAERSKGYRARRQAEDRKAVKCFLAQDQIAYLSAICKIHKVTIAEAIGLALTALITGAPVPAIPRPSTPG